MIKLLTERFTNSIDDSYSPSLGDLNQDGTVNNLDWSIMAGVWFTNDPVADLNKDGLVNSIDFSLMNQNWGRSI